jgi:very-short-patch-repair endonuclease
VADAIDVDPNSCGERRPDATIADLAARQHGVVARRQLELLGLSRRVIEHRLQRRRLHQIHRGVYAVGHRLLSRHGVWMAAVLVADHAVLSHRSAAALWGIRPSDRVEITVPHSLRRRPRVTVHSAALRPDETTIHAGIPVTTVARTLLDLAATISAQHLERAATEAEIRRLASPTSLEALLARYPKRAGTPKIRDLLGNRTIGEHRTRSELETAFLAFLDAEKLPRPRTNTTVQSYEVDFHWPEARLVVEVDGYATHATRAAFEQDRARDRTLQLAGYRVLRITDRQLLANTQEIARQLRSTLTASP